MFVFLVGRCCCGVGYRYHVITNEHTIHVPPNHNDNKEKQPTEDMGEYRIRQIHLSEYKYDIHNRNRHRHGTNQKKQAPFVWFSIQHTVRTCWTDVTYDRHLVRSMGRNRFQ